MLTTDVKTTEHLMTIALQAEREAIRRYTQLAATMRAGNNNSAAALFERMVSEEQEHERLLVEWMTQEGIDEHPDIGPISWRDPHISTTYDEEARDPYYSTPYRALAFAVHNEEIAFRFYTHVAANSEDVTVREHAEILAREELGHAALLRAERRRAYHTERDANITEPRLDHSTIHSEADLLAAAIYIDHRLVDLINLIVTNSPEIDALSSETQLSITRNENILSGKPSPGEDIIKNLEQLEAYNTHIESKQPDQNTELQRLWACCDRSFAFYDAIVENSADETIMLAAQELTSSALDRIGVLKQVFGNPFVSDDSING